MPHSTLKPVATLDLRPDGVRGIPGKIRSLFDRDVAHGGGTNFSPYAREVRPRIERLRRADGRGVRDALTPRRAGASSKRPAAAIPDSANKIMAVGANAS